MSGRLLRIVVLEETAKEARRLMAQLLETGLTVDVERVESMDRFEEVLRGFEPDLVLSGPSTPHGTALRVLNAVQPVTPLVVVTDALDGRSAAEYMNAGADDLVLIGNLERRLRPAVEAAIARRERLARLTPRQLQVLRLVVEGHTTREIAVQLGIGVKTVESHRAAMMKVLDLHDIASVVRYAVKVKLVPPEA